jgi:hypothetical protein
MLARDIRAYFQSHRWSVFEFAHRDAIDLKRWFAWARDLRLSVPAPFEALVENPSRNDLEQQCMALQREVADLKAACGAVPTWDGFDGEAETHPPELDVALQAWRAVSERYDGHRPLKEQIRAWIEQNYPKKFSAEALKRIAIVCNWEKTGGKPSSA